MRPNPVVPSLLALLSVATCRQAPAPAPAPPAPTAVESAALGLRFAALPEGIRLAANDADRLAFDAISDGVPGSLVVTVAPVPADGADLPGEAKAFGAAAVAAGGKFFGGNQLVTPYGDAYTARALVDAGAVEERRVFLLHPDDSFRLVTFVLRYPPGETAAANARLRQMLDLLAALEPFAGPAPTATG